MPPNGRKRRGRRPPRKSARHVAKPKDNQQSIPRSPTKRSERLQAQQEKETPEAAAARKASEHTHEPQPDTAADEATSDAAEEEMERLIKILDELCDALPEPGIKQEVSESVPSALVVDQWALNLVSVVRGLLNRMDPATADWTTSEIKSAIEHSIEAQTNGPNRRLRTATPENSPDAGHKILRKRTNTSPSPQPRPKRGKPTERQTSPGDTSPLATEQSTRSPSTSSLSSLDSTPIPEEQVSSTDPTPPLARPPGRSGHDANNTNSSDQESSQRATTPPEPKLSQDDHSATPEETEGGGVDINRNTAIGVDVEGGETELNGDAAASNIAEVDETARLTQEESLVDKALPESGVEGDGQGDGIPSELDALKDAPSTPPMNSDATGCHSQGKDTPLVAAPHLVHSPSAGNQTITTCHQEISASQRAANPIVPVIDGSTTEVGAGAGRPAQGTPPFAANSTPISRAATPNPDQSDSTTPTAIGLSPSTGPSSESIEEITQNELPKRPTGTKFPDNVLLKRGGDITPHSMTDQAIRSLTGLPYPHNRETLKLKEPAAVKIVSWFAELIDLERGVKRAFSVNRYFSNDNLETKFRDAAANEISFRKERSKTPLMYDHDARMLAHTGGQGHLQPADGHLQDEGTRPLMDLVREDIVHRPLETTDYADDDLFARKALATFGDHQHALRTYGQWRHVVHTGGKSHNELIRDYSQALGITSSAMGYRYWQWKLIVALADQFGPGILLFMGESVYKSLAKHVPRGAAEVVLKKMSTEFPVIREICDAAHKTLLNTISGEPRPPMMYREGAKVVFCLAPATLDTPPPSGADDQALSVSGNEGCALPSG